LKEEKVWRVFHNPIGAFHRKAFYKHEKIQYKNSIVINSITEELFWRGYLLDKLDWKPVIKILFSTILFLLSHIFMWGVFSITIRSYIMIMPLLLMGIIWGYVYYKTKSLKWCIVAHFFVDIMNLSVWVFLNIYIPPVIQ